MAEADNVQAKAGMAGLMTDVNPPAARALIAEVLKTNPNYVPAHVLNAQIALDDGKRDEAKESLTKALAINPNSLEARSIDAAIAFLEDRKTDFDAKVADILKINPRLRRGLPPGCGSLLAQLSLHRGSRLREACRRRRTRQSSGVSRARPAVAAHRRRIRRPGGA
jgi:predicted Zn-dependent protease